MYIRMAVSSEFRKKFTLEFDEAEWNQLERLVREDGGSMSAVVRRLVREEFERRAHSA